MTTGLMRQVSWWGLSAATVVLAAPEPVHGQVAGAGNVTVLRAPASVRSAALNGAGVALVGHAGSVFANPAGLATIRRIALEGGFQAAPYDGAVSTGALGVRLRQFDVGFGVRRYELAATPVPGFPTGAGTGSRELLAVGSLVYRFGLIAIGASGKYVAQDLVTTREEATSADIGMAIAVFDIMALGFAVQNVGGNWRSSGLDLDRLTRTGLMMNYVDPQGTMRLLSTFEFQWPEGRRSRFVLGGEGGIVIAGVGVMLRVAYASGSDVYNGAPVTYGGTLQVGSLDIDFAHEPNDLTNDPSQRIGVRILL